jgi:dihydrofolate reductase
MKVNMILITDSDYGISKQSKIPWKFKEDLHFFYKTTKNNICIMGSTTAKDLGKPLINRINIVISSNDECNNLCNDDNKFIVVRNLEDAIKEASKYDKEIFIVGGSRLYNEVLESVVLDKIYYIHINKSFGCDNFVNPLLDRDDMSYEIIDTIKYDSYKILTNVELTFYLITKK